MSTNGIKPGAPFQLLKGETGGIIMISISVRTFLSLACLSFAVGVALMTLFAPGATKQAVAAEDQTHWLDAPNISVTSSYTVFWQSS